MQNPGHAMWIWVNEILQESEVNNVVSMANISHRSMRHARINSVYTPNEQRKNGYASALMAELSFMVLKEGLIPMLYADITNSDSNKVYKSLGYKECGRIDEIHIY